MRLQPPDPNDLDLEQQSVFESIASGPRGGVRGPLAVWLHRARFAELAQALGEYCRYHTTLEPRLSELAILVTARIWRSEYEWHAHKAIALTAGLSSAVVEDIRVGRRPACENQDEAIVYEFASELHTERRVSNQTYARAVSVLGQERVVDLVGLLGYYGLISMTINVFEVPLPEAAVPELVEPNDG